MRLQKIKMAGVTGIGIHMNREKETSNTNPDIDFSKSDENIYLQKCDNFRNAVNERISQLGLTRKPRKDATVLVDCIITASPESMKSFSEEERMNFFKDAYKAVQDRFGADNIINAVVHRDEPGAEHMDVSFVPCYFDEQGKGHLSAKDMLGGHKEMSQLQTYFYDNVFKNYNLERGVIRGDG
ncbi:MAG: plasmid recombination protein, partial [Bacteroidaceae bacterium]|nr:plasmid recombination protein [Bacteroidaceae bacterium]